MTIQGKKEEDKPLAALLPPEFKDVDAKDLFPEFRPGQVSYLQVFFYRS